MISNNFLFDGGDALVHGEPVLTPSFGVIRVLSEHVLKRVSSSHPKSIDGHHEKDLEFNIKNGGTLRLGFPKLFTSYLKFFILKCSSQS